jgi:hypothetical protein
MDNMWQATKPCPCFTSYQRGMDFFIKKHNLVNLLL